MMASPIELAAQGDPDALPLSSIDLRRMKRTPQAKIIRRALRITQEDFQSKIAG
jgi:putative transcriptional regulator